MINNMKKFIQRILVLVSITSLIMACSKDESPETITINSVKIGEQIWMTENLDVDHYRNGDVIPEVKDPTEWLNLTTGAWCYYENQLTNGLVYGKLYNWYAVIDARGLAPTGWHVASKEEWNNLINFLGGESEAAGKMKEAGTFHWTNNPDADNSSGFTALPGGYRHGTGNFNVLGQRAFWWSSTQANEFYSNRILMDGNGLNIYHDGKAGGMSVRCISD
jgi:uncharacterized protein (TIGR02145 family)